MIEIRGRIGAETSANVINIDKNNLVSYNDTFNEKNDLQTPVYAVISNKGNLILQDNGEMLLDYIRKNIIYPNLEVNMFLYNTETNFSQQLSKLKIKSLSYNNNNRQTNIELYDNLEQLQEIDVPAINYVPTINTSKSLSYIYNKLYDITIENGFLMLNISQLDNDTKNILENTILEYPILESGNLWESWDKLCLATLSNMFIDRTGTLIFKHKI